jgi:hypothetical protein
MLELPRIMMIVIGSEASPAAVADKPTDCWRKIARTKPFRER